MPREYHADGSYTDRYPENSGPVSITHNPDGSVREQTTHESSNPLSLIPLIGEHFEKDMAITRDGDGNIINGEWRKP